MAGLSRDEMYQLQGQGAVSPRVRELRESGFSASVHPPDSPRVVHGGRVSGPDGDSFVPMQRVQPPQAQASSTREFTHRFTGLGVGLTSVLSEHLLSHPCMVLRRQCQVHNDSAWYHLTPFTLFQVVFNIQRHQSLTTLWKGIGSVFIVRGISVGAETAISEFTPLPREVNRHSSFKRLAQHLALKSLGILVTTPFYASSLVETVQSEIASEQPGVFDCLKEGAIRLVGWTTQQSTRLLPIWKLALPTVFHGLLHYMISSVAQYIVLVTVRSENEEKERDDDSSSSSHLENYYPELLATFTGKLMADTLLYPLETILHRIFLQGSRTIIDNRDTGLGVVPIITRYEGAMDCLRCVITEEGFGGLYKGFGALILQYGMHWGILKLTQLTLHAVSQEMNASKARRRQLIEGSQRLQVQMQTSPTYQRRSTQL